MKDSMDSTAVGRAPAPEPESFTNRKLIRPTLPREHSRSEQTRAEQMPERRERTLAPERAGKRTPPPDQTHAENFYYQKQMQSKTPMVIVLQDGEQIYGVIEWYDKSCIKLNRTNGHPNLLIYKTNIKYLYKESEGNSHK